jgi:hypothetical protein
MALELMACSTFCYVVTMLEAGRRPALVMAVEVMVESLLLQLLRTSAHARAFLAHGWREDLLISLL